MSRLIGTKPNQMPTNADLGTMAYQNTDSTSIKSATIRELHNTPDYTGKRGPNKNPSLLLDFANGHLPGYFPVVRRGEQAYLDKSGIMRWSARNEINCDHDPETLEPLGMRVEATMTNHFATSRFGGASSGTSPEFRNSFIQGCTHAQNTTETLSPDGKQQALKLVSTSGSTNSRIYSNSNPIYNGIQTFSFFAKKVESLSASKFISIDCDNVNIQVVYNLQDGEIHYVDAAGIGTSVLINWGIEPYPNGWYRCHATLNNAAGTGGTTSNDWRVYLLTNTANPSGPFTGNEGAYLWGAQLEASEFPTSHIRTFGQSKTRSSALSGAMELHDYHDFDSKKFPNPNMGLTYLVEGTHQWKRDNTTNYYVWTLRSAQGGSEYLGLRMGGSSGRMAHQIYTGTQYYTHEIGQHPDLNSDVQVRSYTTAGSIGPKLGFQASCKFHKSKQFPGGPGSGDYSLTNSVYGNANNSSNQGSLSYVSSTPDYTTATPDNIPGRNTTLDELCLGSSAGGQPMENGWIKRIIFYPGEVDKETLIEMAEK